MNLVLCIPRLCLRTPRLRLRIPRLCLGNLPLYPQASPAYPQALPGEFALVPPGSAWATRQPEAGGTPSPPGFAWGICPCTPRLCLCIPRLCLGNLPLYPQALPGTFASQRLAVHRHPQALPGEFALVPPGSTWDVRQPEAGGTPSPPGSARGICPCIPRLRLGRSPAGGWRYAGTPRLRLGNSPAGGWRYKSFTVESSLEPTYGHHLRNRRSNR